MKGRQVHFRVLIFSTAGLVVALDQFSKYLIQQARPHVTIIPGLFDLVYVRNTGAAFGIFQGRQYMLTLISVLAALIMVYFIIVERSERKGFLFALALILGGTVGNVIDRIRLRYVIDFLDFYVKTHHWPAFNLADSAISIGVVLLVLMTYWEERKKISSVNDPACS